MYQIMKSDIGMIDVIIENIDFENIIFLLFVLLINPFFIHSIQLSLFSLRYNGNKKILRPRWYPG